MVQGWFGVGGSSGVGSGTKKAPVPEHVGFRYEDTLEWLAAQGVRELCVFERRERRLEPIG